MIEDAIDNICNSEFIPKINPFVAEGVAYHQMHNLHLMIHKLASSLLRRENEPRLPEGFDYVSCELVTPEEEYLERGKKKNRQSNRGSSLDGYQYLPTDTYFVRYIFKNGDDEIKRAIQIPFVRRGGIMRIVGVKYSISAVMKKRGLSTTPKGFFIAFDANPVNFERIGRHFLENGKPKHIYIPISNDLHRYNKSGPKGFKPPLAAWLFAKYGVKEAFRKYLDTEIIIFDSNDSKFDERIDTEIYSICRAPASVAREEYVSFAIAIEKDKLTKEAEVFIGTLIFAGQNHGDRMTAEFLDSSDLWKMLLGYAAHGAPEFNDQKHIVMIIDHLSSIEQYVDHKFKMDMLAENVVIDDIYDCLFHVISETTKSVGYKRSELSNVWGRYLTCAEYVISGLRSKMQNAQWDLINAAKDPITQERGLPVSKSFVEGIINRAITADVLTHITAGHGEVMPIQCTTDNMLIGITSKCIDESEVKKAKGSGKKTADLNDPTKHLHSSFLEVGSVANLPKSNPYGLSILNSHLLTDEFGKVIPKPANVNKLAALQLDLNQKG